MGLCSLCLLLISASVIYGIAFNAIHTNLSPRQRSSMIASKKISLLKFKIIVTGQMIFMHGKKKNNNSIVKVELSDNFYLSELDLFRLVKI